MAIDRLHAPDLHDARGRVLTSTEDGTRRVRRSAGEARAGIIEAICYAPGEIREARK